MGLKESGWCGAGVGIVEKAKDTCTSLGLQRDVPTRVHTKSLTSMDLMANMAKGTCRMSCGL